MTEEELDITAEEIISDIETLLIEITEDDVEALHRLYGKLTGRCERRWRNTRPHLRMIGLNE